MSCRDDSTVSSTDTTPSSPSLDILNVYESKIGGAIMITGKGTNFVSWSNSATGESGYAIFNDEEICVEPSFFAHCFTSWKVIVPLTDGSNDIHLTDGDATYDTTVLYTDSGPPEVEVPDSFATTTDRDIYVGFTKLIDPSTITSSSFYATALDGSLVSSPPRVSENGDGAHIEVSGDAGYYTATVTTEISDYWGTPMSVDYSWEYQVHQCYLQLNAWGQYWCNCSSGCD